MYERLASGARINRASDDAAGIAIADRLGTNARLYAVAGRNVNDGISVVNIASAALTNQTGILTRLAELAEQSANGTFSDNQRGALSKEYRALLAEYARIGDTTEFNGVKLLRGSRTDGIASFAIQVGVTSTLNSIISIATGDSSSLSGQIAVSSLADTDTNDDGVVDPFDYEFLTGDRSLTELTDIFNGNLVASTYKDASGTERTAYTGLMADANDPSRFDVFTFEQRSDGRFEITSSETSAASGFAAGADYGRFSFNTSTGTIDQAGYRVTLNGGQVVSLDLQGLRLVNGSAQNTAISFTGVESVDRARLALDTVNARISELGQLQGRFGAFQSRLGVAASLVAQARETSLAAESRIRDADIGAEAATLARLQISQQAAVSVLAQANQQPAFALQLLRG